MLQCQKNLENFIILDEEVMNKQEIKEKLKTTLFILNDQIWQLLILLDLSPYANQQYIFIILEEKKRQIINNISKYIDNHISKVIQHKSQCSQILLKVRFFKLKIEKQLKNMQHIYQQFNNNFILNQKCQAVDHLVGICQSLICAIYLFSEKFLNSLRKIRIFLNKQIKILQKFQKIYSQTKNCLQLMSFQEIQELIRQIATIQQIFVFLNQIEQQVRSLQDQYNKNSFQTKSFFEALKQEMLKKQKKQ